MALLGRALLLYWSVYALDFSTSALFIALGYGFAETNQFQVALITSPGPGSILSWMVNQKVFFAVSGLGIAALMLPADVSKRLHLWLAPVLLSSFRLLGITSNVLLRLNVGLGVSLAPALLYGLLCVPVLVAFRGELRESLRTAQSAWRALGEPPWPAE